MNDFLKSRAKQGCPFLFNIILYPLADTTMQKKHRYTDWNKISQVIPIDKLEDADKFKLKIVLKLAYRI